MSEQNNPIPGNEPTQVSRTEFLKALAGTAVFVGAGGAGLATWQKVTQRFRPGSELKQASTKPNYGMAVDISKCIGCGLCVQGCSNENNVPEGTYRTWIERYVVKKDGEVLVDSPDGGINGFPELNIPEEDIERSYFVPKLCNHCVDSPCTQVCPVGATFDTPEGAVIVDYDWCIGCGYCIQACPYGTRFWNPERKTADKCTMCYHRITKGGVPACVEVCPTKARLFGDLNDPESEISKFLHDNPTDVLKPHLRTGAKLQYKGLQEEVL